MIHWNILFEGLSAGKPIICATIEPMIEISKDVGFHVPFNDVEKLVEKITILKENKKLYEKLSKNALIKAEKYSWGNLGKKFERIFKLISK
ncbi:unnamed protein product [marine sediment metagenome]|uniref:Glycosyl transferase family 1 domain-containing protein n=1 Tax=marine sediment metagenome TaxID=412755 RepID=X1TVI1_9ZZZZ